MIRKMPASASPCGHDQLAVAELARLHPALELGHHLAGHVFEQRVARELDRLVRAGRASCRSAPAAGPRTRRSRPGGCGTRAPRRSPPSSGTGSSPSGSTSAPSQLRSSRLARRLASSPLATSGDVPDPAHVQDQQLEVLARLGDLAHHRLGAGEQQVAVHLVDPGAAAVLLEHRPVGLRALHGGRRLDDVVRVADRAVGAARSRAAACSSRSCESWRQAFTPRTLLPCSSSRGENTASASCPGSTATMPPPTPLLAAMPTDATHSPAASYMPHVDITLSTRSV